jgi:hypothetical protein
MRKDVETQVRIILARIACLEDANITLRGKLAEREIELLALKCDVKDASAVSETLSNRVNYWQGVTEGFDLRISDLAREIERQAKNSRETTATLERILLDHTEQIMSLAEALGYRIELVNENFRAVKVEREDGAVCTQR